MDWLGSGGTTTRCRRLVAFACTALVLVGSACGTDSSGTCVSGSIIDATNGGSSGFYWLPPVAKKRRFSGTFDPNRSPQVQVCELSGESCSTELASLAPSVDAGSQAYTVTWQTRSARLDPNLFYRVSVFEGSTRLGYFDVDVVASSRDLRNACPQAVGLVAGRPLTIAFRLETSTAVAVEVQPSSTTLASGQTVQLAARVLDAAGNEVPGQSIVWSSDDESVATVSASGLVTGVAEGQTVVRAASGALAGTATVTVTAAPPPGDITGTEGNDNLVSTSADETIIGLGGDDTYSFALGSGLDTVIDSSGNDTASFGTNRNQVAYFIDGAGNLIIDYGNVVGQDQVVIQNNNVETIKLNDGAFLSNSAINTVIQNMTAYAALNDITLTSVEDVKNNSDLMAIVAGNWIG